MLMAVNAIYKIYDGSAWVEYYFRTSAAQVGVDTNNQFIRQNTTVNGQAFSLTIVDGTPQASVTINGQNIISAATAPAGHTLQYIVAADTIASALGKLDKAAYDALNAIPNGVITTSNWSDSLDTIYNTTGGAAASFLASLLSVSNDCVPLVHDGEVYSNTELYAIGNVTGTGFLKRTGNSTWSLDPTNYVPTTRKINGSALSSDLNFYATNLYMSSASGAQTISAKILALESTVQGTVTGYSISTASSISTSTYANSLFKVTTDPLTINYSSGPTKILTVDGREINLSSLKVGDDIYLEDSNYPDRWVTSNSNNSISLAVRVEARQPWSSITGTPTTLAGYGITDAHIDASGNGYSITIGSESVHPLFYGNVGLGASGTEVTASWGSSVTVGYVEVGSSKKFLSFKMPAQPSDTKNTAGSTNKASTKLFLIGAESQGANPQSYSNVGVYIGTDNELYSNSKKVSTLKVTVASSAPANPNTGDIFIQTSA